MTYGWNTHKTAAGYAWTVYSFTYGKGTKIIHSGVCKTRVQAMGQAKRHVLPLRRARDQIMPKFQETFCSQCGQSFGPGDSGYSHCKDHIREQVAKSDEYSPTVREISLKFMDWLDRKS